MIVLSTERVTVAQKVAPIQCTPYFFNSPGLHFSVTFLLCCTGWLHSTEEDRFWNNQTLEHRRHDSSTRRRWSSLPLLSSCLPSDCLPFSSWLPQRNSSARWPNENVTRVCLDHVIRIHKYKGCCVYLSLADVSEYPYKPTCFNPTATAMWPSVIDCTSLCSSANISRSRDIRSLKEYA